MVQAWLEDRLLPDDRRRFASVAALAKYFDVDRSYAHDIVKRCGK
jgi:hypothetical protein